jgi:hypothetical protein
VNINGAAISYTLTLIGENGGIDYHKYFVIYVPNLCSIVVLFRFDVTMPIFISRFCPLPYRQISNRIYFKLYPSKDYICSQLNLDYYKGFEFLVLRSSSKLRE